MGGNRARKESGGKGARVSDTAAGAGDGFAGAVDHAAGHGARGGDAVGDSFGDEVVVWCHSVRRLFLKVCELAVEEVQR